MKFIGYPEGILHQLKVLFEEDTMTHEFITRDPKEFKEKLWTLKKQLKFCDSSLSFGGSRFYIHAVVLAANSQLSKEEFTAKEISPNKPICTEIDKKAIISLIDYCYKGSFNINDENAMDTLRVANTLKMDGIVKKCFEILKKRMNLANCLSLWNMTKICNHDTLKKNILLFIKENIDEISKSDDYLSLEYSDIKKILHSRAKPKSDNAIFRALKRWTDHESSRANLLDELLEIVNIKCLPMDLIEYTNILSENMNIENCLSFWKNAEICEHEALDNIIIPFVKDNIDKVSQSKEYLSLEFFKIKKLFDSRTKADSEQILYEALKRWIDHDSSRKKHLNELLDYIKLNCLPKESLLSEAQSICGMDAECLLKFFRSSASEKSDDSKNCTNKDNTLIVLGGNYLDQSRVVEIFHLDFKKWIKISDREYENIQFSAASIGEKLIIMGGSADGDATKSVEYYDLKTGRTESLPKMKYARESASAVNFQNNVYIFGGLDESLRYLKRVEKWSPSGRTWKEVASMSTPRCFTGAAVLDDEIFVVGGRYEADILSLTEAYNPVTNTWRKCANTLEKRGYSGVAAMTGEAFWPQCKQWGRQETGSIVRIVATVPYPVVPATYRAIGNVALHFHPCSSQVAVVNGYLFTVGGYNFSSNFLNSVEKYDKSIDKWTMVQSLDEGKYAIAAGNLNGLLVVTGGNNGSYLTSVEAYDEKNNKWTNLPSLNYEHAHHCVAQVPWTLAKLILARNY